MNRSLKFREYDKLAQCVETQTLADIADTHGTSKNAIRVALNRRGLKAVHELYPPLRAQVQDMKPQQAVEHLLYVLEQIALINPKVLHPIDDLQVKFSPQERRLLIALYDSRHGFLRKGACWSAMYFDRIDGGPSNKLVDVFIYRLRKKLPPEFGRIETIFGTGYRFLPAQVQR